MKMTQLLATSTTAFTLATSALAAPVDREWLRVHPDDLAATQDNIATLGQIFDALYASNWESVRRLYADNYVQHNPKMDDGVEGVIDLFSKFDMANIVYDPVLQIAEGPYVTIFSRLQYGADQPILGVVDINYVQNGKSREHWDIIQPVTNPDRFFTVNAAATPTDRATIEANKELAANFINTVFNQGHVESARDFVAQNYIRHGENDDGLEAMIEEAQNRVTGMTVDIKRIIGQDDLVMVHSRVSVGPADFAQVDIWRVTDGLLTEHWGLTQSVPDEMNHRNGMF